MNAIWNAYSQSQFLFQQLTVLRLVYFFLNLARRCEIRDSDLEDRAEIRVSLAESSARGRRDAGAELQSKIPVRSRRCQFLHQKVH